MPVHFDNGAQRTVMWAYPSERTATPRVHEEGDKHQ
jgi:hypothetical protein